MTYDRTRLYSTDAGGALISIDLVAGSTELACSAADQVNITYHVKYLPIQPRNTSHVSQYQSTNCIALSQCTVFLSLVDPVPCWTRNY